MHRDAEADIADHLSAAGRRLSSAQYAAKNRAYGRLALLPRDLESHIDDVRRILADGYIYERRSMGMCDE